jgi:hypothetical protein
MYLLKAIGRPAIAGSTTTELSVASPEYLPYRKMRGARTEADALAFENNDESP